MSSWRETVTGVLRGYSQDELARRLLEESHLTERQLQALLIDFSSEEIAQIPVKYEEKAQTMLRPLTRGAYNRTLAQARRNVTRAFFTLYVLGYVGLLDLGELSEHMRLGDELKSYVDLYLGNRAAGPERQRVLSSVHRQLVDRVESLARPSSLRPSLTM